MRLTIAIVPCALGVAFGACGSSGNTASNPATLWLANDMVETRVKLVETEPPPF